MKKISRRTRILLGLAAVAAVGLIWWLFARGGQGAAPMVAMLPATQVAAPQPVAPAEPAPVVAPVSAAPAQVVVVSPPPTAVPVVVTSASSVQPSALVSAASAAEPPAAAIDEVAATERMYLAHAPLRDPEVADPDSESNRRILQTMVEKALRAPAATTAPSAASTTSATN